MIDTKPESLGDLPPGSPGATAIDESRQVSRRRGRRAHRTRERQLLGLAKGRKTYVKRMARKRALAEKAAAKIPAPSPARYKVGDIINGPGGEVGVVTAVETATVTAKMADVLAVHQETADSADTEVSDSVHPTNKAKSRGTVRERFQSAKEAVRGLAAKALSEVQVTAVEMLLSGAAPEDIAKRLKITKSRCLAIVSVAEQELSRITRQEFASLLRRKVYGLIASHTTVAKGLMAEIIAADNSLESTRREAAQARKRLAQLSPVSIPDDQREHDSISGAIARHETREAALVRRKLDLYRALATNNDSFFKALTSMGVSNLMAAAAEKGPPHSSTTIESGEIEVVEKLAYSGLSLPQLKNELKKSMERVGRYLAIEGKKSGQVGSMSPVEAAEEVEIEEVN